MAFCSFGLRVEFLCAIIYPLLALLIADLERVALLERVSGAVMAWIWPLQRARLAIWPLHDFEADLSSASWVVVSLI